MEAIISKWSKIVAGLKPGVITKIRRDTIIAGVTKPFGALQLDGAGMIRFTPARGLPGAPQVFTAAAAPAKLADIELLASFRF